MKSPCLGCENRKENCHSKCGKYFSYKMTSEIQKKKKREAKESEKLIMSYVCGTRGKMTQKSGLV